MNCAEARDAMLVAELAELRMSGAVNPLTVHLNDCDHCCGLAEGIVKHTAHVGSLVVARDRVGTRSFTAGRFVMLVSLPIAAAAVFVATIAIRRSEPAAPPVVRRSLPVVRNVSVDVGRGQQATVLKTPDPAVTVIWLTPGVGQ